MKEHFGKNGYFCLSRFWLTWEKNHVEVSKDFGHFFFFLWSHEKSTFICFHNFLVAATQLYESLCPSVCPLICPSVRPWTWIEKFENSHFRPCPPARNWCWPCIRPCSSLVHLLKTCGSLHAKFTLSRRLSSVICINEDAIQILFTPHNACITLRFPFMYQVLWNWIVQTMAWLPRIG